MSRVAPFESHTDRYERWFEQHQAAYCSEMLAVRAQMPLQGLGVEIGVGSGRFAAPFGVAIGVDPSFNMLRRARARGVAEALPFADDTFDFMLMVTLSASSTMYTPCWRKRTGCSRGRVA